MTITAERTALSRTEAAYAHLASFAKGDRVVVSGRGYDLEGTVTRQQQEARNIRRAYLIVTGTGTLPDGDGGWRQVPVQCVITVGKMLAGRCFTLASVADAAAGNWSYFDSATWAMHHPDTDPLDTLRAACAAAGITAESPAVLDADAERLAREERWS